MDDDIGLYWWRLSADIVRGDETGSFPPVVGPCNNSPDGGLHICLWRCDGFPRAPGSLRRELQLVRSARGYWTAALPLEALRGKVAKAYDGRFPARR